MCLLNQWPRTILAVWLFVLTSANVAKADSFQIVLQDDAGKPLEVERFSVAFADDPNQENRVIRGMLHRGRITVRQASPDTYRVRIWLRGGQDLRLRIVHREDRTIPVVLKRTEVVGRVKLAANGLANAPVTLSSASLDLGEGVAGDFAVEARTDPQGQFRFDAAIPGTYYVGMGSCIPARSPLAAPVRVEETTYSISTVGARALEPIRVGSGRRVDLGDAFSLQRPDARLTLQVPGGSGLAVLLVAFDSAGSDVEALAFAKEEYPTRFTIRSSTNAAGLTPKLELPAGRYLVSVRLRPRGARRSFTARKLIDVEPGTQRAEIRLPRDTRPAALTMNAQKLWSAVRQQLPPDDDFTVRVGMLVSGGPFHWPALEDVVLAEEAGSLIWVDDGIGTLEGLVAGQYSLRPVFFVTWIPDDRADRSSVFKKLEEAKRIQERLRRTLTRVLNVDIKAGSHSLLEVQS